MLSFFSLRETYRSPALLTFSAELLAYLQTVKVSWLINKNKENRNEIENPWVMEKIQYIIKKARVSSVENDYPVAFNYMSDGQWCIVCVVH